MQTIIDLFYVKSLDYGKRNARMIARLPTGYRRIQKNVQNVNLQLKRMGAASEYSFLIPQEAC